MNFGIYNNMKQYVTGYLLDIDSSSSADEMTKAELQSLFCYDDNGFITWRTPDRNYIFKIQRLYISKNDSYIINFDIYNSLGIKIHNFKMSINEIIKLLYMIANRYEIENYNMININCCFDSGCSCNISIDFKNNNICFNENKPDIGFYIDAVNEVLNKQIRIVTTYLTFTELREFCFHVFFYALIDLDLNIDQDKLNIIEEFVSY